MTGQETQVGFDLAVFLQRFSSKVLWHFTGYQKQSEEAFQVLLSIAKTGTINATPSEGVVMASGKRRNGYSRVCMCDIPFRDLRIHVNRYGVIGIACHKERAIVNYFNPMLYVH